LDNRTRELLKKEKREKKKTCLAPGDHKVDINNSSHNPDGALKEAARIKIIYN
jgi:hypothetical protein